MPEPVPRGEGEADAELHGVAESKGLEEADIVPDFEEVTEAEAQPVLVSEGDAEGDSEILPVGDPEDESEALALGQKLGVEDWQPEALTD